MPTIQGQSWREIARQKKQDTFDKMPKEWILPSAILDEAKPRRRIAGEFIEELLDEETQIITGLDAPKLVYHMVTGSLSAVQVVTAFCKRAAYAHQLVCLSL